MLNALVLLALGVVVVLAIRSMMKSRKSSQGCTGNRASCHKCQH